MKKVVIIILSFLIVVCLGTAFGIRDAIIHSGVEIAVVPVVANGSLIKMNITAARSNQTVTGVTYELVDAETVNVHVSTDFLARNEEQEEQTLQLLLPSETQVHFLVNEKLLSVHLEKDGAIWKTIG